MNFLCLEKYINSLSALPEEEWAYFQTLINFKPGLKGEHLFREGKICKCIYFIEEGGGRMYYIDGKGNDISYDFFFEHSVVTAFASFINQSPSNENIVLTEDSTILVLYFEAYRYLIERHPVWQNLFSKLIIRDLLKKIKREEMLLVDDYDTRFRKLFKSKPELFLRVEQKHIASYLRMTPETLSRVKRRTHFLR